MKGGLTLKGAVAGLALIAVMALAVMDLSGALLLPEVPLFR